MTLILEGPMHHEGNAYPKPRKKVNIKLKKKVKKKKRIKLKSIPSLIKKADKVVSQFIRKRDPKCVTCGKPTEHAGHYIRRMHKKVRWNVNNIAGQCCYCNTFLDGNMDSYALWMINKYGIEHLQWLESQKGVYKVTRDELERIILAYSEVK